MVGWRLRSRSYQDPRICSQRPAITPSKICPEFWSKGARICPEKIWPRSTLRNAISFLQDYLVFFGRKTRFRSYLSLKSLKVLRSAYPSAKSHFLLSTSGLEAQNAPNLSGIHPGLRDPRPKFCLFFAPAFGRMALNLSGTITDL